MFSHTSIIEHWGYVIDAFSGYNRPSGKWLMLSPPPNSMPSAAPYTTNAPNTPYAPYTAYFPHAPYETYSPNAPNAPSLPNAPTAESVYGSHAEHLNYGYDGYEESKNPQQHY